LPEWQRGVGELTIWQWPAARAHIIKDMAKFLWHRICMALDQGMEVRKMKSIYSLMLYFDTPQMLFWGYEIDQPFLVAYDNIRNIAIDAICKLRRLA
jgi:hypothetical protein